MQSGSFPSYVVIEAEKFTSLSVGPDHSWWKWGEWHLKTNKEKKKQFILNDASLQLLSPSCIQNPTTRFMPKSTSPVRTLENLTHWEKRPLDSDDWESLNEMVMVMLYHLKWASHPVPETQRLQSPCCNSHLRVHGQSSITRSKKSVLNINSTLWK